MRVNRATGRGGKDNIMRMRDGKGAPTGEVTSACQAWSLHSLVSFTLQNSSRECRSLVTGKEAEAQSSRAGCLGSHSQWIR